MWIEVDDVFCDEISDNVDSSKKSFCELLDIITNLLNMMKKNRHIVFFSRKMLRAIKNNINFSSNIRTFTKWILCRTL